MTSLAAYLAALTGAAPQEGLQATPADPAGAGGLFAALLQSSGAVPGPDGESAPFQNPFAAPLAASDTSVPASAGGDAALGEDLTQNLGLPQGGAGVEATIVENISESDPGVSIGAEITSGETPQPASLDGSQTKTPAPASPVITSPAPATPGQDANGQISRQARATAGIGGSAAPRAQPGAPATGLENALGRAAQQGRENGLLRALNTAPQARGAGDVPQPGLPQGGGTPGEAAGSHDAPDTGARIAGDAKPAIAPGESRPEFAPRAPDIIQRIVQPGTGQAFIRVQERTGGEAAGSTSPPTLTVNVPAPTASPGPAPATAPHVPVSALAVHIAQQAHNGARRFDIRLDPPELGRIEVRLDVTREGQVMTHLVVERAETLDLLQRDARQLERLLQNAGLDTSEDGLKFSLKDQGLAKGGDDSFFGGGDEPGMAGDGENKDDQPLVPDSAMPPPGRYMATGGLDIRI